MNADIKTLPIADCRLPNKRITVVAGFPRCGSSLMMRMLDIGGLPCVAENKASYEDPRACVTRMNLGWIGECESKAIKILETHRFQFPEGFGYDFIWMMRDPVEQAKSQLKFLKYASGLPVNLAHWPTIARGIAEDTPRAIRKLQNIYGARICTVSFERILLYAPPVLSQVKHFLGADLNVEAMGKEIRQRQAGCYPGFLELEWIDRQ